MNCYLQTGQTYEGIAVYRRFREMIAQGMEIMPSRKIESLYQSLLNSQSSPAERAA
jgi:DNA-binding SARP family transcriptional activator